MNLRLLLWRIERWLADHIPTFCAACKRTIFEKDAKHAQLLSGGVVPLCEDCHRKYYGGHE